MIATGQLDRSPRHFDLVGVRSPGDHLDRPAIPVAGGKILARINPRRVFAKDGLDMAGLLEKRIPVDGREETQAEHAVADRDLIGRLAALFAAEDLVRVGAARGQLVLEMLEGLRAPLPDRGAVGAGGRRTDRSDSVKRATPLLRVVGWRVVRRRFSRHRWRLLAHCSARRLSSHRQIIFSDRRLRFSSSTRRSMVGNAQSSPIVKGDAS